MAKKSKKKESEPKNEVITNCDNQQFAVANSCLGKRPVGPSGDLKNIIAAGAACPRPVGPSGDLKNINIESLIRTIRGQKVMVDFDLAMLYGVKTKALNQSVKRNIKRFPDDFMFQLTKEEWVILRSQIVTTRQYENKELAFLQSQFVTAKNISKIRTLPYAFTRNGVGMLVVC